MAVLLSEVRVTAGGTTEEEKEDHHNYF